MRHLLVTNDFPPKLGGIQTYLWELWRRLPPGAAAVLTRSYAGDAHWDAKQPFPVVRARDPVLLPLPGLARRIEQLASETGSDLVVFDPILPLGLLGPHLSRPYGLVLQGGELSIPARVPGVRRLLAHALVRARLVVAAGGWVAEEARRLAGAELRMVEIPPPVDVERFRPLTAPERRRARLRFGLPAEGRLLLSVGRLVPRKGVDVLLRAAAGLAGSRSDLCVAVAGEGRDRPRLERLNRRLGRPARLLGPVSDERLAELYGCADVFALACRDRPGGLVEGFGVVLLEAAAAGLPQVVGASGGTGFAVSHGVTGLIVRDPADVAQLEAELALLLDDAALRARMGRAARDRAVEHFSADALAARLEAALERAMEPEIRAPGTAVLRGEAARA